MFAKLDLIPYFNFQSNTKFYEPVRFTLVSREACNAIKWHNFDIEDLIDDHQNSLDDPNGRFNIDIGFVSSFELGQCTDLTIITDLTGAMTTILMDWEL